MDWDAKATLNRLLEHLTPAGKVDWKAVMAPDIATKISRIEASDEDLELRFAELKRHVRNSPPEPALV